MTRFGGLRTRFVVAFVLAVAVVAGTTAAGLVLAARSWVYTNAQDVALAEFGDELADLGSYKTDLPGVMQHGLPSDATVVLDGRVMASGTVDPEQLDEGFLRSLQTPGLVRFLRLDSSRILMAKSLRVIDPEAGPDHDVDDSSLLTVYVERPLVGVQGKLSNLAQIVAVTLTAGMVASGLFGWWLATTLVRPLRRLDAAAARAADGDLDVRLPEVGMRELGQVTGTFNEMLRQHGSAIDRLTESDERSRRFVADVSHELRTPLAALVPMGEILREDADQLPPDTAAAARVVGQEIDKLARLVEDLIEMSRHDSGHARLDVSAFDLGELARETLASRGWDGVVPVRAAAPTPVRADARRLEIVIANLVGNALPMGPSQWRWWCAARKASRLWRCGTMDRGSPRSCGRRSSSGSSRRTPHAAEARAAAWASHWWPRTSDCTAGPWTSRATAMPRCSLCGCRRIDGWRNSPNPMASVCSGQYCRSNE